MAKFVDYVNEGFQRIKADSVTCTKIEKSQINGFYETSLIPHKIEND